MELKEFKVPCTTAAMMFFDESYSRTTRLQNAPFWREAEKLEKKYPDISIASVIVTHVGEFWIHVEIKNANSQVNKEFEELRRSLYYSVRLRPYPEFSDHTQLMQILAQNTKHSH